MISEQRKLNISIMKVIYKVFNVCLNFVGYLNWKCMIFLFQRMFNKYPFPCKVFQKNKMDQQDFLNDKSKFQYLKRSSKSHPRAETSSNLGKFSIEKKVKFHTFCPDPSPPEKCETYRVSPKNYSFRPFLSFRPWEGCF